MVSNCVCATASVAGRADAIRRACVRLCGQLAWSPLQEVPLPNNRRADILAVCADGVFVCIEIKSGPRDFLVDQKWPEYRAYADQLYFAVDEDFPQSLLPEDTGLIVCSDDDVAIVRDAPRHPLAPARRRALTLRFAMLAAQRLAVLEYPVDTLALRLALRCE